MNAKVTDYIASKKEWEELLTLLRNVLLTLPLVEDVKWGMPAYIYKNKNILGLSAFKTYCGLWFHHGCFLKDEANILINAQKDKTKGMRQMRFTSINDVDIELVKQYILEAIENAVAGKEIKAVRNTKPIVIPEELHSEFCKNEQLQSNFNDFSLSKQREFCNYISSAKRLATKQSRLEKIVPLILNKIGLNDKYKNG
ncbi:hypothetical protein DUT90_07580 [Polaribacter sp. WD7]|uniref:YdeI/OmpD-associated family protein n=1 Tax=Polaribacter sp. WD7 TaxID=2269061 RepID=UPI000DF2A76D|nr:DUF1801 domain-containing protein [Polaribacter sp. WD7]RCS26968.1 hypothetical protein DUT90_07580 [Polaribacter sp. WD7]